MPIYTIWASDMPTFTEPTLVEGASRPIYSNGDLVPGCDRVVRRFSAKSWRSARGVFTKYKNKRESRNVP